MIKRISLVEGIVVTSVSESASVRIGDTNEISAYTKALAVQQLKATYDIGHEEKFKEPFPKKEIPFPLFRDEVTKITFHEHPFIKTGPIRSVGISSSSMIHIGSITHMYAQSHILHIRQIQRETEKEEE